MRAILRVGLPNGRRSIGAFPMPLARRLSTLLIAAGVAGALFAGSASALPAPAMVFTSDTPSEVIAVAATSPQLTSTVALATRPGMADPYKMSERRLATGPVTTVSGSSSGRARSKTRLFASGLVLAAMSVPIALLGSHHGEASAGEPAVETRSSDNQTSVALLGDGDGDHPGDDEECDTGETGGEGDTPGDVGGGNNDDVPQGLPEPRTVLLIGTGLITLLSFRNRRY